MNLRRSARGQQCTLNIVGVCNYDPETTVGAHVPGIGAGEGMARKPDDWALVWACSACHDAADRRVISDEYEENKWWYIARALYRTHKRMMEAA